MNELYNNKPRPRFQRSIFFVMAAILILVVLMILPGGATAFLTQDISGDNQTEVEIALPKDCRLEKVYLKANENVPRQGKLVTLVVNGLKFPVADFEKLPECNETADPKCENRFAPIDWQKLSGSASYKISYEDINSKLQPYDLEIVFKITGNPDKVKNWQQFVKLHSKRQLLFVKKSIPESEKSKK